jgi:hypothetical protein
MATGESAITRETVATVFMWTGNVAGAVMLPAAAATIYLADDPARSELAMLCGGLWFATAGAFLGLGRGVPMVLLGRVRVSGMLRVVAQLRDEQAPVREGPMVRMRGAVFAMAGLVLGVFGLGLLVAAVARLTGH